MKYFTKLKQHIIQLMKKGLSPDEIAQGIAAGVFIAFIPFFGTHTITAIGAAQVLRLNTLIVILGTQISNPLSFPFQIFLSAEIGSLLLKGQLIKITYSDSISLLGHYLPPILLGSFVLSLVASGLSFFLIRFLLKRRKSNTY
ncbi:MAG: DUF2062 domain-containing protein [Thermodesulfovibrionales bacterium]|nr:DUF2062 domain-containing protein [Thermodesulfovibrionales bacterium]